MKIDSIRGCVSDKFRGTNFDSNLFIFLQKLVEFRQLILRLKWQLTFLQLSLAVDFLTRLAVNYAKKQ